MDSIIYILMNVFLNDEQVWNFYHNMDRSGPFPFCGFLDESACVLSEKIFSHIPHRNKALYQSDLSLNGFLSVSYHKIFLCIRYIGVLRKKRDQTLYLDACYKYVFSDLFCILLQNHKRYSGRSSYLQFEF